MTASRVAAAAGALLLEGAWVGLVVAVWAWLALRVTPFAAARWRYRVALGALLAMAAAPVVFLGADQARSAPWMAWIAVAWATGVVVSFIRIANSLRAVARLRAAANPASESAQRQLRSRAAALGIPGRVTLAESDAIELPCSLGVRAPLVLLPRGLADRVSRTELDAICAHELAHVARRDYAWRLVQLGAAALLFHHPAAGWLSRLVDREREAACDELAATLVDPLVMAGALSSLERNRAGARRQTTTDRPLLDRVSLLVRQADGSPDPGAGRSGRAAVVITIAAASGAALAWLGAPLVVPAAMTMSATLSLAVGLGLLVGIRHAFEPDHLVAVATMVATERGAGEAMRLGASWGVGHTVSLFALATALSLARRTMPIELGLILELGVAGMIIAIGAKAIGEALRAGRTGPVRRHSHGKRSHAHAASAAHVHIAGWAIARRPLGVGLVHGVAGSGALAAVAAATLPTIPEQLVFVLLFGLGSTMSMAAVAGLAGWPLARLVRRPAAMTALSATTGAVAMACGAVWAYPLVQRLLS